MGRYCFPITLIESINEETRVKKARRAPGNLIATGSLSMSASSAQCKVASGTNGPAVATTQSLLQDGAKLLKELGHTPLIHSAFDGAGDSTVQIAWMSGHNTLIEVLPGDSPVIQVETSWAESASQEGSPVLSAMMLLYALSILGGASQRDALHALLDFSDLLDDAQTQALKEVLKDRRLDGNSAFALFIDIAHNKELAEELEQFDFTQLQRVRTPLLFAAGNRLEAALFSQRRKASSTSVEIPECLKQLTQHSNGVVIEADEVDALTKRLEALELEDAAKLIEKTLKWRDRWVTWLTGQQRIDLPYNNEQVVRIMNEPIEDVDEKRALINEAVASTYDQTLEGENIQRITSWSRENGMRLVAGRLSRAFGNQSQLLSVSKVLADKEGLLPYAKKLHQASASLRELQTQAARLLHLIQQQKPTPFAQTVGALNHFEEALFAFQSKEFKRMLREKDEASRRVIGRPDADACGAVLDSLQETTRSLYRLAAEFRDQLEQSKTSPAAFIVLMQRLHPAETVNLANANLLRDVHPGKEDDLRDLMRIGGHYTYSTPGSGLLAVDGGDNEPTHWVIHVDDWIEAIPLFIHERVVKRTVKSGNDEITIEVIETEVDQESMEAFFRIHAEFWAQNIEAVMDSQHVGLARRLLVQHDESLRAQAEAYCRENPEKNADDAAWALIKEHPAALQGASALGAMIGAFYRDQVEAVAHIVESQDVLRHEALETVLSTDKKSATAKKIHAALKAGAVEAISKKALATVKSSRNGLADECNQLTAIADQPTRRTSSLHILTTESAGMTEGYVQTWIEEEIALYNIVRHENLESAVQKRMGEFGTRIQALSRKVIGEFGMSVVIDEVMAQQRLPEPAAVMTVLISYKPILNETAKLGVLIELMEREGKRKVNVKNADDPKEVDAYIKKNKAALMKTAVAVVANNNGKAFEQRVEALHKEAPKKNLYEIQKRAIAEESDYQEELDAVIRFAARDAVLAQLMQKHPELHIEDQIATYIRTRTQLAKSTARKEVVAKKKLHALAQHPLYYYQAAGGNKRYNLLYTPSRVNLGERERDSVVKWRQWVGGADRWAAQAGFEFYSLINEGGVEERPALAYAEIQKTSENALCVTHFAGSNALALLCMAVLEGDAEDMADQMNLREDRMAPPAGEGYGGYCVPKDGLFLAFVLSLQNEMKLRQIGVPERLHDGVMKMAKFVLLHQRDFGSYFDWQRWAADKLLKYSEMKKYFDLRDDLMVFHINKIARAVENLGQPWHETTEGSKLMANLAAQWGVERMIIRAEQVNRFMVFYKAWMIYDALREARQQHPLCHSEGESVIALSAEYKPVQDVRFSTGMRLFELFAQTGDHLAHSLDEEGQNLAYLMTNGFDPKTQDSVGQRMLRQLMSAFRLNLKDKETVERLQEAFPPHDPPGELVMISSTMSSTQDLLFYTSDAKLDEIADQVQVILNDYGLTEDQIRANATVFGGRLRQWAGINQLPASEQDDLISRVGGRIHALVLRMRGPGRSYETDIQGVDVINTGIPFPELVDQFDDMPRLIAMMRNGNPHSALAIADGAAGRARRMLTYFDVMQFFAACEAIERGGVYRGIGLGKRNIDRLREDMRRQRARAASLFDAVAAVAQCEGDAQTKAAQNALTLYHALQEEITVEEEAGKALREEEKLKRHKKWKLRDSHISQALIKISAGLPLQQLDWGTWTAGVGGVFVVIGEQEDDIEERRAAWNMGVSFIAKLCPAQSAVDVQPFEGDALEAVCAAMVRPAYQPETQRFTQQMLVESSSKAVEIAAREALERRKALKVRAERARAFNQREDGFREAFQNEAVAPFDEIWASAQDCLNAIQRDIKSLQGMKADSPKRQSLQNNVNKTFGRVIGLTRASFTRLVKDHMPEDSAERRSSKQKVLDDLALVYTGREIIFEHLKQLAGGYEDVGGIARLAEAAKGDRKKLDATAKAIELFYVTFALAQTLEFSVALTEDLDEAMAWKNITDFFAESINDHWYEYWPWAYSRGVGFEPVPRDERIALAVERHAWLYDYMRGVLLYATELRDLSVADQDQLLGNFCGKKQVVAIGANAQTADERQWRAYNQLREIAFMKTDGFLLPPVIDLDPDLIEADSRVNLAFLYPVGRTHVSRALREGPTINQELQSKKKTGVNIIITRYNDFAEVEGAKRKVILLTDGHLYISEKEYKQALRQQGMNAKQISERIAQDKASGRLTPKGIRVAARFAQNGKPSPIAVSGLMPFHGLPLYDSGQTEAEGLPATTQSRILSDITYDKSIYPGIFTPKTGVHLPPEIDWMQDWTQGASSKDALREICEGRPANGFSGLRAFAKEHPIVLIKGAAESGARNLKVFEIQDDYTRIQEDALLDAAKFVLQVSKSQNVVIQTAIMTSPELWASPELIDRFVDRQVLEWNTPVKREHYPRPQIYGSLRIVASSSNPKRKYDTAFPISLISLQVATNVGRGGTLETLRPEFIQERYRKQILDGLHKEGPKALNAVNEYIKQHGAEWEQRTGLKIGEDLRGVSYGWANYLMCDYLVLPVFKRNGRLVDLEPEWDAQGRRIGTKAVLQDERGRFEGEIAEWQFIHLEPNVGIGLWDRYNLREEVQENEAVLRGERKFDWNNIGQSDRVVLTNFALSSAEYLKANFGRSGVQRANITKAFESGK
ncbi:MAG: hypothetical protein P9L94_05320 [Candidatus Hinthialibacter antarcticus]|nr:hypothetical protein [Candidatus Hinthialibacter antarcticus]